MVWLIRALREWKNNTPRNADALVVGELGSEVAVDGARDLLRLVGWWTSTFLGADEITSSVDERR